ncbi:rodlin [Streptomyces sp. H27-D2]|uniref:rodlin n=1 Tax=Streptomyces sp. H27-D2 TaxID=3046304 RepID=UPI002DBAC5E0|nr:rodlin [Streptomyces sp. H27-D2]MEC4015997.1 rodlin [Streptomyces sp. H27-D2]
MIKKILASAAVVASAVGVSAAPAMAIGNDNGPVSKNGNGAEQNYGNQTTKGYMSPQMSLIQGSLNKPCVALPKLGVQNVLGLVNVGLQDVPILSQTQAQQCVENSTQQQGDAALSHLLDDFPILSQNGAGNGN